MDWTLTVAGSGDEQPDENLLSRVREAVEAAGHQVTDTSVQEGHAPAGQPAAAGPAAGTGEAGVFGYDPAREAAERQAATEQNQDVAAQQQTVQAGDQHDATMANAENVQAEQADRIQGEAAAAGEQNQPGGPAGQQPAQTSAQAREQASPDEPQR
jgi:hypothetical protein